MEIVLLLMRPLAEQTIAQYLFEDEVKDQDYFFWGEYCSSLPFLALNRECGFRRPGFLSTNFTGTANSATIMVRMGKNELRKTQRSQQEGMMVNDLHGYEGLLGSTTRRIVTKPYLRLSAVGSLPVLLLSCPGAG